MGQGMGCCGGRDAQGVTTEKKPNANASANGTGSGDTSPQHIGGGAGSGAGHTGAEAKSAGGSRGGTVAAVTADDELSDVKARSKSVSANAALWREFFGQTLKSFARIGEKHMSLVGPTPPTAAQRAELEALITEVKHEVKTNMSHLLGSVFDFYDVNRSGDLDQTELKAVVDDYASAAQLVMDKCVRDLFAPDGPMVRAAHAAGARTGATPEATAKEVDDVKSALVEDMKVLNATLERAKATSGDLAKQLVAQFDTNGDGKITRSEFIDNFHKLAASLQVSGPLAV